MSHLTRIKGWHSRGYLPHFDAGPVPQSITVRIADSLPASKLEQWRSELACLTPEREAIEYRRRVEEYLDRGLGDRFLEYPEVGRLVEDALLHFDGERYRMYAWVVMPNHLHALLTPAEGQSLSTILHSLKSFTSHEANRILCRSGHFWQADYFDTYVRCQEHFDRAAEYIEQNPVKAGLCRCAEEWPFGSARLRAGGMNAAD